MAVDEGRLRRRGDGGAVPSAEPRGWGNGRLGVKEHSLEMRELRSNSQAMQAKVHGFGKFGHRRGESRAAGVQSLRAKVGAVGKLLPEGFAL